MNIIERNTCIISNSNNLEQLFILKDFPVFMISNNDNIENDLKMDMVFDICKDNGMIQIRNLVPSEILYSDSHFQTSHNGVWKLHNEAFSKIIYKIKPKAVFEIGGSTGILEKTYHETNHNQIEWTILEPLPDPVQGSNAKFIKGYFPQDFKNNYKKELLVHSNVIEHIYEPEEAINIISNVLKEGDYMAFSVPDEGKQLQNKFTTFMNFEHNYFCSETYMDFMMEKYGFRILEKDYFGNGHSIFYIVKKDKTVVQHLLTETLYEINKKAFSDYIEFHRNMVMKWNNTIENSDRPVYLFGAHISTQYYIAFGLNTNKIQSILDNNPSKQGKRVCGTRYKVESPKILKDIDKPFVILPKGSYSEEIKNDILKNINKNTHFLE